MCSFSQRLLATSRCNGILETMHDTTDTTDFGPHQLVADLLRGNWSNGFWPSLYWYRRPNPYIGLCRLLSQRRFAANAGEYIRYVSYKTRHLSFLLLMSYDKRAFPRRLLHTYVPRDAQRVRNRSTINPARYKSLYLIPGVCCWPINRSVGRSPVFSVRPISGQDTASLRVVRLGPRATAGSVLSLVRSVVVWCRRHSNMAAYAPYLASARISNDRWVPVMTKSGEG